MTANMKADTPRLPHREVVVVVLLAAVAVAAVTEAPGYVGELVRRQVLSSFAFLTSIQLIAGLTGIFILERKYPAQPNVPLFSPAVAMDALYTFIVQPLTVVLLVLVSEPLSNFLATSASWLVVDTTRDLPLPVMLVCGLVITDFFVWLAHVLKHKIPLLWRFHVIHHSQVQINMFTSNRIHPIEHVQDLAIQTLPYFILFPSLTSNWKSFMILNVLYAWQQRFQHSNIATNLGPLRYIIVTPQSHRVHHSLIEAHWNSNYGSVFTWDRLFGMQNDDVESYPITGLNDGDFPEPTTWSPRGFLRCLADQFTYPFKSDVIARVSQPLDTDQMASRYR